MINIELIQAAQGDCIWIEYGEDTDSLHRILIDEDTSGTYKHLKKRIENLSPNEPFQLPLFQYVYGSRLDLWDRMVVLVDILSYRRSIGNKDYVSIAGHCSHH